MRCTICDIIKGNIKSYKVFEDENFIAFLDIKPLFIGHCLLSPKQHIQNLYALPADIGNAFLSAIQDIGNAVKNATHAEGTFIAVNNNVSQAIPHLHVHIVPRNKGDGLKGFFWPRTQYINEEQLKETQDKIKKYLTTKC